MLSLLLAAIFFAGIHLGVAGTTICDRAMAALGQSELCAPYFATAVLAAGAVKNAGTEAEKQALLPGIAAGETTATFAWVEDNGRWDAEGTALTATAESGEIVLNGHKSYVVDGHTADLIVVLARASKCGQLLPLQAAWSRPIQTT